MSKRRAAPGSGEQPPRPTGPKRPAGRWIPTIALALLAFLAGRYTGKAEPEHESDDESSFDSMSFPGAEKFRITRNTVNEGTVFDVNIRPFLKPGQASVPAREITKTFEELARPYGSTLANAETAMGLASAQREAAAAGKPLIIPEALQGYTILFPGTEYDIPLAGFMVAALHWHGGTITNPDGTERYVGQWVFGMESADNQWGGDMLIALTPGKGGRQLPVDIIGKDAQ